MKLDCEANLQAEFYAACKLIGLPCALEVTTPVGRHDAVILTEDRRSLLAIIEVKQHRFLFKGGRTRQIQRYKLLGLPVYGLSPDRDPHRLAATIKRRHGADRGLAISFIRAEREHLVRFRAEDRLKLERAQQKAKYDELCENFIVRSH